VQPLKLLTLLGSTQLDPPLSPIPYSRLWRWARIWPYRHEDTKRLDFNSRRCSCAVVALNWGSALFVSERYHGIDAHSASGGQVRGQQRDGQEQRRNTG